jgi:outer membrane receptor protein involved in Fe transport
LRNAVLSVIPIATVERIEILRGGARVLYGEGATGGVIRIALARSFGALALDAAASSRCRCVTTSERSTRGGARALKHQV